MGITSNKSCTGPWDPGDTKFVKYEFTGCPDDARVYNEVVWGDSEDITFGDYNEVCAGAYLDITAGILLEVVIGPMLEVCVGGSFEMAGMPAAMWKLGGFLPETSESLAGQYDIVFGTYYETLYGAMYYWQPTDLYNETENEHGNTKVLDDWNTAQTSDDAIKVHGDFAEVVGNKIITATGANGLSFITNSETASNIIVGGVVSFTATGEATLAAGIASCSGVEVNLQAASSCSVSAPNVQLLLAGDTLTAQAGNSMLLYGNLNEWGQPGVEQPPVADEDDDVPDEDYVEPMSDEDYDDLQFFDALEDPV